MPDRKFDLSCFKQTSCSPSISFSYPYSFICHLNQTYFIVCVPNSSILILAFMNCKYQICPKKPMIFSRIIDQYLNNNDLLQNTILE